MVGAVGEMASVKQHKLWKTGEDGLCCSSSAIQTWLGPSSLLEEQSKTSIGFVVFCVLWATPQSGGNGEGIYICICKLVVKWSVSGWCSFRM